MKKNNLYDMRQKSGVADCIDCGACSRECSFLTKYGSPLALYKQSAEDLSYENHSFSCSLCGLCNAVCPLEIEPQLFFQYQRKQAQVSRFRLLRRYFGLLLYEKTGSSPLFSWYGLPENCTTVYFPGCSMPGKRPGTTEQLYRALSDIIPDLGIVLDCCRKPSADLGLLEPGEEIFSSHVEPLLKRNISCVVVNCPSCYVMFDGYEGIEVTTAYQLLADSGFNPASQGGRTVTVHDPCRTRKVTSLHGSIRSLISRMGLAVEEMDHHGTRTICCGEGGAVAAVDPCLAGNWTRKRASEAGGLETITYCGGCVSYLEKGLAIAHVADMLFNQDWDFKQSAAPGSFAAYHNRLQLKNRFSGLIKPYQTGVRNWRGEVVFKRGERVIG